MAVARLIFDNFQKQFIRRKMRLKVFQPYSLGQLELRKLAAEHRFQRFRALLQKLESLDSLLAQVGSPLRAHFVQQTFVPAFEASVLQRASAYRGRLQVPISQRDGERSLTLQQRLPSIQLFADGGIAILPKPLPPVPHLIENAAFSAGHRLKCKRSS